MPPPLPSPAEAARELARQFARQAPLDGAIRGDPGQTAEQAIRQLCEAAQRFRATRRLGIIARARFAKALQDELKALGYAPDTVSRVTTAVLVGALTGKG